MARNLTYNGDKVSQTSQFVGSEPTWFLVNGTTVAAYDQLLGADRGRASS